MKLYSYYRSSAAFRVRIALALKNIQYDIMPIHLLNQGGEQKSDAYTAINPQQLVPTLDDDGFVISQSLAIILYLEDRFFDVPLLPTDAKNKAFVHSLAQIVACDMHPLNNLRVLQYLSHELSVNDEQKQTWYAHWIVHGFDAFEQQLAKHHNTYHNTHHQPQQNGTDIKFCFGDTPTLADCCLIPQVYNALRFECDLRAYPHIQSIYQHCMSLPAFIDAYPDNQPDCPNV